MPAEWTVRQAVLGKRGSIPDRIRHLLKRLDLSTERRLQSSIAELSHLHKVDMAIKQGKKEGILHGSSRH